MEEEEVKRRERNDGRHLAPMKKEREKVKQRAILLQETKNKEITRIKRKKKKKKVNAYSCFLPLNAGDDNPRNRNLEWRPRRLALRSLM